MNQVFGQVWTISEIVGYQKWNNIKIHNILLQNTHEEHEEVIKFKVIKFNKLIKMVKLWRGRLRLINFIKKHKGTHMKD